MLMSAKAATLRRQSKPEGDRPCKLQRATGVVLVVVLATAWGDAHVAFTGVLLPTVSALLQTIAGLTKDPERAQNRPYLDRNAGSGQYDINASHKPSHHDLSGFRPIQTNVCIGPARWCRYNARLQDDTPGQRPSRCRFKHL